MQTCTITLSSGVPLAISQMPGLGSVVIQFHFDVGPGDEAPHERGMAHLVEHLVLNATPSFPAPNGLGRAFRARGGWINGATSHTGTTLVARVPAAEASFAMRSLAEAVTQPLFTEPVFESERRAILAEIASCQNDNYQRLYDALSLRLEPNTTLGRSIAGTEDDVKHLTFEHAQRFFDRLYRANRLIITIAGNLRDPDLFLAEADDCLAPFAQKRPAPTKTALALPAPLPTGPQAILTTADEGRPESSFLAMFHGPGSAGDRVTALALEPAADLLASGDDCRLMDELRWKRGLIYSIHYDVDRYPERSLFSIGFSCPHTSLKECGEATLTELRTMVARTPTDWVEHWKRRRTGRLLCAIDDPEYRADRMLFDVMMTGSARAITDTIKEIHAVTPSQIEQATRQWLNPEQIAFGVVRGE